MRENHTDKNPRLFYGWLLVIVLLLALSVGTGTSVYMYSVVAGAVGEEFAAGRTLLMMGSTGMLLTLCAVSPFLGAVLDRYPVKRIMMAGAVVMGLGFILIGLATHIWQVIACYVVFIGVGMVSLSHLTASTLLARWFVRHRGLALGIVGLGTQFGGLVYPPFVAGLIEAYDWRVALTVLGVAIMVLVPVLAWLTVVDHPRDMGLQPDGDSRAAQTPSVSGGPVPRLPFGDLFRQRNFVLLVLTIGAVSATNTTLLANLTLFATDIGETVVRGAFLVSLVAVLGMFTSPLTGWLCDIVSIRLVAVVLLLCLITACLVFSLAGSYPLLLVAAFFHGVAGGGILPLWASMIGKLYDTRLYGQVMGSSTTVIMGLTAIAPPFAGWMYDTTGSYRLVLLMLLAVLAVMAAALAWLRVPGSESDKFGAEREVAAAAKML